jgi:hypothetical protein
MTWRSSTWSFADGRPSYRARSSLRVMRSLPVAGVAGSLGPTWTPVYRSARVHDGSTQYQL